jgi:hypothetical protein
MVLNRDFGDTDSHAGIFDPALLTIAPPMFSLVHLPIPLPPSLCQSTVYTDSVWLGGGEGLRVLGPVGDHILQEFNTLYLASFRTYKTVRPPETKPRREEASDR